KKQYKLCTEILRRFHQSGLLPYVILIGSWAVIFYEGYFKKNSTVKNFVLRTRDIDFLIENPKGVKLNVDIPELLKDLGFVLSFTGSRGYVKLSHADLILEFLVPEKGRGVDGPVPLPSLGMNAVALRFLNFLTDNTIQVKVEDFVVTLPHPANFALHKLIVSQRRLKEEKAVKDKDAAISIIKALIANDGTQTLRDVFNKVPTKWQKKIIEGLKSADEPELIKNLKLTLQGSKL
ncbi:MAG: hypothetical protein HYZ69_03065, partial [Candidatus Colwellbacteria bacterium]|nr:hypothetical protein [Candidatus Colwellbacteria bacterium]